jgi:dTDP-4-dehydrorhamnose reductase
LATSTGGSSLERGPRRREPSAATSTASCWRTARSVTGRTSACSIGSDRPRQGAPRADARYVLIGATGQLGYDLARTFDLSGTLLTPRRSEFDILDAHRTGDTLRALRPTHVINTAAWNKVDAAEEEPQRAFALNAEAVGRLAAACESLGATLVHFSTDYVFDGARRAPYTEDDAPNPISAYGESKLEGERLARQRCERALVIRVCGLFGVARSAGKGGTNFVETMLRLAREGRPLRVVADQVLGPSYTLDVARAVWRVIASGHTGLCHVTSAGETSWHDFAREIFRAEALTPALSPVTSEEFGARARRPPYSVLAHRTLAALGIPEPRGWQAGLAAYLTERRGLSAAARPGS